jgi:hypothetical protein
MASGYGAYKERQAAKKEQTLQRNALEEQKREALQRRKNMIDAQREQLGGTGTGTRGYSTAGIKASIGDKLG